MLQIRAFKQPYLSKKISVFIEDEFQNGVWLAEPVTLKQITKEFEEHLPTVELPQESAQKLMDDLWDCGLRPSEGSGSAGAMKAVQDHLADLRILLFKKEKIEGVNT